MLSVLITARNEDYLGKTIENVLENARGEIEVIVILDGYIPNPQLHFDSRVTFVHYENSIGQRQGINEAARRAKGKYIMKLDAHCAVDEGFDVKLAKDCEYDWIVVPRMYNLDIETFKPKLYKRTDYMYISSPTSEKPFRMAYYGSRQPKNDKPIDDIMCCVGCCWFMHKDRFWELGGLDEGHGGWGQMGIEIALKAWLSGGSFKVNKNTWFAHWFRGHIGFPYKITGNAVERARRYSRDLWLNDKWDKAKRPLKWVIDKFDPPEWNNDLTILYYTANVVSKDIDSVVIRSLKRHGYPIVSVSQEPMDLGKNIVVPKGRSLQKIYEQVLIGAKNAKTKYVALCEDDCLYVKEHFKYRPKTFAYNLNRWLLHLDHGVFSYRERPILSQCIANREVLIENLEERLKLPEIPDKYCGEMGVFDKRLGMKEYPYETFRTEKPNMVVCHKKNTTGIKLIGKDAEPRVEIDNWGKADYWIKKFKSKGGQMKYGRGIKPEKSGMYNVKGRIRRQWSHIGSVVSPMEEMMANIIEYRDRRNPIKRAKERLETIPPIIKDALAGKTYTDDEVRKLPYYTSLRTTHRASDKKAIMLIRDLMSLTLDIKANGMKNPIDLWKVGSQLVIHRGWRRILILNELGYEVVPCRLFQNRNMFLKHAPYRFEKLDNSIHGLGMRQFMKLQDRATDKYWVHSYTKLYDRHIGYLRPTAKKILEIGVYRGASLLLWREAFPNAEIYGVEKRTAIWQEFLANQKRIKVFVGHQEDVPFLKREVIPNGKFDVIIDDGLHHPKETKEAFNALWDSVAEGGWYIIEDLYGQYKWGKSNIINSLKNMIDDMNNKCEIKAMHFYYNICFIQKNKE